MCKHITLLLPNRPGELFKATKLLGQEGINILGFHVASEARSSVFQLVCDKPDAGYRLLRSHYRYYCTEREVLAVRLENTPGELSKVLEFLQERLINVSTSYQLDVRDGRGIVIFEFDGSDVTEKAAAVLTEHGIELLSDVINRHG